MKRLIQSFDQLQIVGVALSIVVPLGLVLTRHETIESTIVGLVLAATIQGIDLQCRLSDSERRILSSKELDKTLYRDEWLLNYLMKKS